MGNITQDNRLIAIDTPLGKDKLLLTAFRGHEKISGLFQFQIEMLSQNHEVAAKDLVGKTVLEIGTSIPRLCQPLLYGRGPV